MELANSHAQATKKTTERPKTSLLQLNTERSFQGHKQI